jgi:hypothetical protein
VCVCVCVCVWERERERERDHKKRLIKPKRPRRLSTWSNAELCIAQVLKIFHPSKFLRTAELQLWTFQLFMTSLCIRYITYKHIWALTVIFISSMMENILPKQSYKAEYVKQNAQTSDNPQTLIKTLFLCQRNAQEQYASVPNPIIDWSHCQRNILTGFSLHVQEYAMKWAQEKADVKFLPTMTVLTDTYYMFYIWQIS